MSIVAAAAPAIVPGRKPRRAARLVEVRMRRTVAGEWLIERESESTPGLAYTIRVTKKGAAFHEYVPGGGPVCPADGHGHLCRHLDQAAALVEIGEEIIGNLCAIADERREWWGDASAARVEHWRCENDDAALRAAALGCHLVSVKDEGWTQ